MGWNPKAAAAQALVAATGAASSCYTGLALGTRSGNPVLYAANNGLGRIDVFDQNFKPVTVPGGFADPNLPAGAKPYNISNINGSLYVTYMGPTAVVDVFDADGNLTKRLATGGTLHNPVGHRARARRTSARSATPCSSATSTLATRRRPRSDQRVRSDQRAVSGAPGDAEGNPIWIDGLWALAFGNGGKGGAKNVLYFTAGIQNQKHGLFGSIAVAP